jgi:hypothetical protein
VLIFTALLAAQAYAARKWRHRRRAFGLAGVAMLIFGAYNFVQMTGVTAGPLLQAMIIINVLLLAGAVVSYIVSARNGEMREQYDQYATKMREYAQRRTKRHKP